MTRYATISAKISEEEREEIRRLKLNPTEIIRNAVHEEIKRARNKDQIDSMKKVSQIVLKLGSEDIVKDIREDRER